MLLFGWFTDRILIARITLITFFLIFFYNYTIINYTIIIILPPVGSGGPWLQLSGWFTDRHLLPPVVWWAVLGS